jgi:hypothetical protein
MTIIHQAGIALIAASFFVLALMVARVIRAAARGQDVNAVPIEVYSGISIACCVVGLGLLIA